MMSLRFKSIFFLLLFVALRLNAQKTAVFNGKTYFVYPQVVQWTTRQPWQVILDAKNLLLEGLHFPAIIGSHQDGEYLVYTNSYVLKNRRKRNGLNVYDTIYRVYGTFTIRNNTKEGPARIYSWKDQTKTDLVLSFRNDLPEGEYTISGYMYPGNLLLNHERYKYDDDEDLIIGQPCIYKFSLREGLISDSIRQYMVNKRDTLPTGMVTVSNGLRNGPARSYEYFRKRRKYIIAEALFGSFKDNRMHGEWIEKEYDRTSVGKKYYVDGELTKVIYVREDGSISFGEVYGRDSVLKYFPDHANYAKRPYTDNYREKYEEEGKVIFNTWHDTLEIAFVLDDYASESYFTGTSFQYSCSEIKDSIVNGRRFRYCYYGRYINYLGKEYSCYLVDTCSEYKKRKSGYRFCESLMWQKKWDKKGKLIKDIVTDAYYKLQCQDSFKSIWLKTEYEPGNIRKDQYYYPALDYTYSDYAITSGAGQGSRVYHKVVGNRSNACIIRYIYLPSSYDTICLVDTLVSGGIDNYQGDYYFHRAFEEYLNDKVDKDKNKFSYFVNYFFRVWKVKHTCILLGQKVYTGKLTLNCHYTDKARVVKAVVYNITETVPDNEGKLLSLNHEISLDVFYQSSNLKMQGETKCMIPERSREAIIVNGSFHLTMNSTDIFGEGFYLEYCDNKINSEFYTSVYEMNKERYRTGKNLRRYYTTDYRDRQWKIKKRRMIPATDYTLRFANGKKQGQWHFYEEGILTEAYNFHQDKLDGLQLEGYRFKYSGMYFYGIFNYRNNQLEGRSYIMGENGYPEYMADFRNGKPHGLLICYGMQDTGNFVKEIYPFDNGYLSGDFLAYWDSGGLRVKSHFEKADSIYYMQLIEGHKFNRHNEQPGFNGVGYRDYSYPESQLEEDQRIFSPRWFYNAFYNGYLTFYYKGGAIFKEGARKEGEPTGAWTFYREGNRIYKRVDFKDTILNEGRPDSLHIYGYVKAYYDNGNLMFTGLATDKRYKHSCEAGSDMPIEEDQYLEFYDTLGNNILRNGSGYVVEYQSSGHKLREGRLDGFQKQGLWVQYSIFGLPEEMGMFKNGKRNGRWLEGDLGGLNLNERVCFMSDEAFKAWVSMHGGNLTLTEVYYADGKEISRSTVSVIKN